MNVNFFGIGLSQKIDKKAGQFKGRDTSILQKPCIHVQFFHGNMYVKVFFTVCFDLKSLVYSLFFTLAILLSYFYLNNF